MKTSENAGQLPTSAKIKTSSKKLKDLKECEDELDLAAYEKAKNDKSIPLEEVLAQLDKKHAMNSISKH